MNIIYDLICDFFYEEKWGTMIMILISFIINILQTNVISFITANIISHLQENNKEATYLYFKYFIYCSVLSIILYTYFKHLQNVVLTQMRQWIKSELVKIILLSNNENLSNMNFNNLSAPINRIASLCFMVFSDLISFVLPNITFIFIIALYFLYSDSYLATIFISGNILILLYSYFCLDNIVEHNEKYEHYTNECEHYLLELLNNIDKIIYRGQTDKEIEEFKKKSDDAIHHSVSFYSNLNFHTFIMNIILYITLIACIMYAIMLRFDNKMTITIFITFFTILLLYREKMSIIIQQYPEFVEFYGRTETVLKKFKDLQKPIPSSPPTDNIKDSSSTSTTEKTRDDATSAAETSATTTTTNLEFNKIVFKNVDFKYSSTNKMVLQDFNMSINTNNKVIGIMGLSGNGKSTISKLILKLYTPVSGDIFIDDKNLKDIDTTYLREQITYVNQNTKLFDRYVVDNMFYGCNDKEYCNKRLDEIMKYPKIAELFHNIDIHNKKAGSQGSNLSGGQSMIVNIIGGLINNSKMLILDEPTNALDGELKQELLGVIRDFKKYKKSIIIITHDKECFKLFDQLVEI